MINFTNGVTCLSNHDSECTPALNAKQIIEKVVYSHSVLAYRLV